MKKIICIILAICLIFPLTCIPVSASSMTAISHSNVQAPLEDVITEIYQKYPDASISVDNGVINVVIPQSNCNAQNLSRSTASSSIYAPAGGTWDNFKPPFLYWFDQNLTRPHAIVFLPEDYTKILLDAKEDTVIQTIIYDGYNDNMSIGAIQDLLYAANGNTYSYNSIIFMAIEISVDAFNLMNYSSLKNARDASNDNKVRIEYCTSSGWPINYYFAWEGNYVDCSPWEDFNPDFNVGYFNII